MVRLLIVVFALIILGAGSFVGLVAFGVVPDVLGLGIRMEDPPPKEAAPPPPVRPDYVDIAPFVVPVILPDGTLHRSLYLDLRLEVAPGRTGDVYRRMPVLHDAYVRYLHDWIPLWLRDHDDIDLREIKGRLKTVSDRVVGEGVVQQVLYQSMFDQ